APTPAEGVRLASRAAAAGRRDPASRNHVRQAFLASPLATPPLVAAALDRVLQELASHAGLRSS
ncbi:MAG: hypothetical protein WAZ94_00760, partial [Phycisphaerales bacterium]